MEQVINQQRSFKDLTLEETKMVNGGEPTKTTSFFYDAFYYLTKGVGKVYRAAVDEGLFTRSWWEDFSIDLSS